ncbi:Lrp/AsnC family transcriptional regulator [Hyphomonas sp.]|uniref:Lrp/AsnC family transcriptional regulator n=1 Tax=Hyphomonas sp. TaxID=87 RepID=UPI00391D7C95
MTRNDRTPTSTQPLPPLFAPSGVRLDATDLKILRLLQTGARASIQDIARRIELSHSGTLHRLRRLEESGAVLRYMAELDASIFEAWPVTWIDLALTRSPAARRERFEQAIAEAPEVMEAIEIIGEFDLSLRAALRQAADWPVLRAALDPQAEFIDRARIRPVARIVKRAVPHPLLVGDPR